MQIIELLKSSFASGTSDLFVTADKEPYVRRFGQVLPGDADALDAGEIEAFRQHVLLPEAERKFRDTGSFDAGLTLENGERFRLNFYTQQGLPGFVARPVLSGAGLTFEALNLPGAVAEFAEASRGLVLIAGASGSGKSTTLAAMVSHINRKFNKHIVTIEDPIEYIHRDEQSLITQREVGADTVSFGDALRNVVRESPDVIVIGEMRDLTTMQAAIAAALTGHLVLSTIHTADCVQSVERIINHFPEHLRRQIADDFALALCGIMAQRLLPRADGKGMIPAVELMKGTPSIRNMIAERDFKGVEDVIKRGHEQGMTTFSRALSNLVHSGEISMKTGAEAATNREEFMLLAKGMESGIETFRDRFDGEAVDDDVVNIKRLLQSAVANGASDLLVTAGARAMLRVDGELVPLDTETLKPVDTQRLLFSILSPRQRTVFEEKLEIDFALSIKMRLPGGDKGAGQYRFRANGFYQRGNVSAAFRIIPTRIPPPEELKIPPAVVRLTEKKHGLILVTGPTGHGKSTTLASLIDCVNASRSCHIITIEDPIEYVHVNKKSVVEQREVGADTKSFAGALKYVLRQDPDVILIGEMRDPETMAAALTAAETGHLVFATLHTNNAPQSVDRIVDSFPGHQQNQIRLQLAGTALGIIAQRLIPCKDGVGRVPVFEVMLGTHAVQALIREGKSNQLQSVIETSFKDGMITMDKALEEVYSKGLISKANYDALSRNFKTSKEY